MMFLYITGFREKFSPIYSPQKTFPACIPSNNGTESKPGWTKIQQMYWNVHPNLALVLLFERTEVERSFVLRMREFFLPALLSN